MSVTRFYTRFVPVFILIAILVTASYAFAAANVVTTSYAGDGTGTVSGYNVTVSYTLNATNPATIDSAALTLSQPANSAHVRINGAGSWIACTGSGTSWTCNLGGTSVAGLTSLQVVAAQ